MDHIQYLADQLLPRFIPKNPAVTTFSFQFTVAPAATYSVSYVKKVEKGKEVWVFTGYEEVGAE
jgi:hypothetical protein